MKKKKLYRYLGRNGIITSPVLLDNIEHIPMLMITANDGFILTNGESKLKTATIFADELDDWIEIEDDTVGEE